MGKYINRHLLIVAICSFILSIAAYFIVLFGYKNKVAFETTTLYPISNWEIFIFFAKPLVLLVPFVVLFTIIGSYLITLNWGKEVKILTVIRDNDGKLEKKSKIKFFSDDEKELFKIMMNTDGDIYQNDLTEKSGLPRYQVSRILSRFQNYGIVEKERFGMTNRIELNIDHVELN